MYDLNKLVNNNVLKIKDKNRLIKNKKHTKTFNKLDINKYILLINLLKLKKENIYMYILYYQSLRVCKLNTIGGNKFNKKIIK